MGAFDITVTQQGEIYTVSGKDAPKLHAKLQTVPEEAKNLKVGEMKDGAFTLEKMAAAAPAAATA
jgi:hypothetical protein